MLRVTSLLSTCALLAAVGCNAGDHANAAPEQNAVKDKLVHKANGSVQYNGYSYDSRSSFFKSPAFQANPSLRCGTREAPPPVINGVPEDCSFDSTTIAQEYGVDDGAEVLEIEMIIHVILNQPAGTGNIDGAIGYVSQERIDDQLRTLNGDFRAITGTAGGADSRSFDSAIQFKLATHYPTPYPQNPGMAGMPLPVHPVTGQPQRGVLYVESTDFYTDGNSGTPSDMKTALHWDTAKYMNIYSNDAGGGGTLGYSYFPQWRPTEPNLQEDGIVMLDCTIGGETFNDGSCAPYHLGRTFTHEVGHWVGLFHTFQSGCGDGYMAGDLVLDTHPESGPNFGCPANPGLSCADMDRPDPIENYMDYSDDVCMTRYTAEQSNRARCSIRNYRSMVDPNADNFLPRPGFSYTDDGMFAFMFTDTSTDQAGTLAAWDWDFGDGNTSTVQNPNHTYAGGGVYDIVLTVTDNDGNQRSAQQTVVAGAPPDADFLVDTNGYHATFTDQSTDAAPGTVVSWEWDFGDGGTSSQRSPLHAYGAAGTYTVTLTVMDDSDLPDTYVADVVIGEPPRPGFEELVRALDVEFTDRSTTPAGNIDMWNWDFGDGNTATDQNPTHSYAAGGLYNVTLMVGNDNGDTATYARNVLVNARPTVGFDYAVDYQTVTFTDTSADADSPELNWWWDFGDGSFSAMASPTHMYEYASDWTVTLQVSDNFGNVATVSKIVSTQFAPGPDAGMVNGGDAGNPVNGGSTDGCVCTVDNTEKGAPWPAAALFLGLGLFILRRRRAS